MSNPAVARYLPLLFSHRLKTLGCNGAPFDYMRGHECMVTRHGHIHYGDVVGLGSKVSTRFARWLALCVMGVVMVLFTTANTWPSSSQNQSLRERTTLWSWTPSQNMGPAHGPGNGAWTSRGRTCRWKRQPRRAHNDCYTGVTSWVDGLIVLPYCGASPWLALISAPLFFLWFPTERPDFMLAVALVASRGKLDRRRSTRAVY